ncbi:MAG: hypothetical protein GY770_31395, partial [Aestuariibacter sp.]|nr:hypothetical protein [Aestuariibacter sp.]
MRRHLCRNGETGGNTRRLRRGVGFFGQLIILCLWLPISAIAVANNVDSDNDGLADELESRDQTDIVDWPELTGNASFANGMLSANGGTWNYQANSVRFSSYGFGDNYRVSFTVDALGANNMIGLGSV